MANFRVTNMIYTGLPGDEGNRRTTEIIEAATMEVGIGVNLPDVKYPVEQGSLIFYNAEGQIKAIRRNWAEMDRMD